MTDTKIARLVRAEGTIRTVELDDGSIVERSAGSVSWRNNNPGNLKFEFAGSADRTVNNPRTRDEALAAAQARYQGVVDLDQWGNAVFETYEAGRAAKIQLLERRFSGQTIEQILPEYSRADYSGATNHGAQAAAIFAEGDRQGVDLRGKTVGDMSQREREALADGIRLFEGWREGEITVTSPIQANPAPVVPEHAAPIPEPPAVPRAPHHPDHPDNSLLEHLRTHVRELDRQAGRSWDDASERLAASALVMAKERGYTADDDLRLAFNRPTERYAAGELLHLARLGPGMSPDPGANRATMPTQEALSLSPQERYQQVEVTGQAQAEQLRLAQQELMRGPDNPTQGGPTRTM